MKAWLIYVSMLSPGALLGCEPAPPTGEPAVASTPTPGLDADAPSAKHDIAGRSAFPAVDETLDKPIAYKRLSDIEQFALPIDPADIPAVVEWQDASKYVGYDITVQGMIVNIGQSRDGKVNFLNFDEDWRGKFYMVIFDDLAETLDKSIATLFEGKVVRVKGKVETHRGNPQLKITSMDQVEFVGD
jgi:hypothetical protein